jgi:hypothetical protein
MLALAIAGAVLVAPAGLAATAPKITFDTFAQNGQPTTYTLNRVGKAVASRTCTVTTGTTTTDADCGHPTTRPKAKPTRYAVPLLELAPGTYTYTVNIQLTDGGRAIQTSSQFTVASTQNCWMGSLTLLPDPFPEQWPDLALTAAINGPLNAEEYVSYDGTCTGNLESRVTVVQADTTAAAEALCIELVTGDRNGLTAEPLSESTVGAPDDYYWCGDKTAAAQ